MTISTSKGGYYYYRCTGKKRLHNCDATPIRADYLEHRVAEAIKMVLGRPDSTSGLIRILRDQAEKIQGGAVSRLRALIDQEKDISAKLDNAVDAVLNGLNSPAIQVKIKDLELQKTAVEREMRALKTSVDASAIPEQRLQEILDRIVNAADGDINVLLSIVYRVEVGQDTITIWTLLDADPNGTIDHTQDGVTIRFGVPSGVPTVIVTSGFIQISVARKNVIP